MKTTLLARSVVTLLAAVSLCLASAPAHAQVTSYNNITNFSGFAYANAGATNVGGTTYTSTVADDLNVGSAFAGQGINQFSFSVANLNTVVVAAQAIVSFYAANGAGSGPGTLLASLVFNPIAFTSGTVQLYTYSSSSNVFTIPSNGLLWAGVTFSNGGGSTATAAQLNNLGQGIFNPPTVGSSTDAFFQSTSGGNPNSSNPSGSFFSFGGSPTANFGWALSGPAVPAPDNGSTLLLLLGGVISLAIVQRRLRRATA